VRGLSTVGRSRDLRAIVAEHEAIYEAARAGHAGRAAHAMERHLLITEELLRSQVGAERSEADGRGEREGIVTERRAS
jgi:DNA-binding GntR family transcriptional regulator